MTTGWVLFGVILPAVVAGIGWIGVFVYEWDLRRQDRRRAGPAE